MKALGLVKVAAGAIISLAATAAIIPAASADLPQCTSITDLNCQGTFINTTASGWPVQNLPGFGTQITYYTQVVNGVSTTWDVWPFRNPTEGTSWSIHNHLGDRNMFPAGYSDLLDTIAADKTQAATTNATVAELTRTTRVQAVKITRLQARIAHLRQRLTAALQK